MSRRKQIRSKEQFTAALQLERAGDAAAALKLYQKSAVTDPANSHAWNRQMVLLRKAKSKEQEVKLIKQAIAEYRKSYETKQQDWLTENQDKADSSRELARVLGLLEPTGLPKKDDTIIEKWQTRLYLLEYRIKNARKKKAPSKKSTNKSPKRVAVAPKKRRQKAATQPKQ
ncbi:hypothetical protein SAMN05421827_109158 [Pedobacter terrae]|uniref:Tetratricopeptide repeat protein n=1 Tax=Pedobacter terrae TaxID=405671 RepID=A0A1G7W9D7_9SPHI|nr:hypothetical protein [Pedobacter terrae]SDG68566.1 hypothetical protein SAMN05421827_109158 [Pedobacter terrae]